MRSMIAVAVLAMAVFAFSAARVDAQIVINTLGTPHSQNFDGMTTGDIDLFDEITGALPGFHFLREFGNTNPNAGSADDGSGTAGGFKNYGQSLQLDRALGLFPDPTTGTMRAGIRFVNNSGFSIHSIEVTYTGEQWRDGGGQAAETLVFAYRTGVNVNDLVSGVYTPVSALHFVSPTVGPFATDLDGNQASNRQTLTATFPVAVAHGSEFMLRWEKLDASGDDHGLAIDDLTVTPRGASTAAPINISGRVVDANGRGISRTMLVLSGGSLAEPMFTLTNPFGYYTFANVESGEAYLLRVESKRHRFANSSIFVNPDDNLTGLDFVANP
ncbi:MAG: carboxypeptidase-like regulatory domain-containing protein [Pyrinomonadaceae bacterium]